MLEATYRLKLGQDEFELKATVKDEKEFFETMSFYSSLPKTAPGGATDLRLAFRTTTDGYKYYSLVSESEKMEFRFGQNLEKNGGGLFPKGWEPLFQGEGQQQAPPPAARPPVAATAPKPSALPPSPTGAPRVTAMPPKPSAMPTLSQPAAAVPMPAVAPAPSAPTPAAMPASVQPAPVQNPQVTAVANDVLARFNIKR